MLAPYGRCVTLNDSKTGRTLRRTKCSEQKVKLIYLKRQSQHMQRGNVPSFRLEYFQESPYLQKQTQPRCLICSSRPNQNGFMVLVWREKCFFPSDRMRFALK